MDYALIYANLHLFVLGVKNTVSLVALSLVFGGVVAVPSALLRAYKVPVLNGVVGAFSYFFRGTPLLAQIYLIYYGLAQFMWIRESMFWPFLSQAYWCAFLAFGLNTAAYTIEFLRRCIEETPFGELEAARSYGMTKVQQIRRIVLPGAFRRALPLYANEVILLVHGSAVASTVTIVDILGAGQLINSRYYVSYEGFLPAAFLYALLIASVTYVFKRVERKYHAHLR